MIQRRARTRMCGRQSFLIVSHDIIYKIRLKLYSKIEMILETNLLENFGAHSGYRTEIKMEENK